MWVFFLLSVTVYYTKKWIKNSCVLKFWIQTVACRCFASTLRNVMFKSCFLLLLNTKKMLKVFFETSLLEVWKKTFTCLLPSPYSPEVFIFSRISYVNAFFCCLCFVSCMFGEEMKKWKASMVWREKKVRYIVCCISK